MRFFTLVAFVQALCAGVYAGTGPISAAQQTMFRDAAAVGYLYTQGNCSPTPSSVRDASGNTWYYLASSPSGDGTSATFIVRLLSRPDLSSYILFFPGSQNFDNFQTDFMTDMVNYPGCSGCLVHQGFYQAWLNARSGIISMLNKYATNKQYKLVVGGGSLGGGVACLAYADFATNPSAPGFNPSQVVTFGEPRVGNFVFAKWMNGLTGATSTSPGIYQRVTHGFDAIPRSPGTPGTIQANSWQHHGTEWNLQDPGSVKQTALCYNNADQTENGYCVNFGPGNPGDHTTYPGYNTLQCPS